MNDLRIGGATADISAHPLADIGITICVTGRDARRSRHDLPGGAKATLEGIAIDERLLKRVDGIALCQTLYRCDKFVIVRQGYCQAAIDTLSLSQHGARATFATVASLFGASQADPLPEQIEQCRAGVDIELMSGAVDVNDKFASCCCHTLPNGSKRKPWRINRCVASDLAGEGEAIASLIRQGMSTTARESIIFVVTVSHSVVLSAGHAMRLVMHAVSGREMKQGLFLR